MTDCSHWFFLVTVFAFVVKVKDLPHPLGGWNRILSWLDILSPLVLDRWILCPALYEGIDCFPLFIGRVPPLPALQLQVASWSDKLRRSRACGSLNQYSLHALRARSPFFLQCQKQILAAYLLGRNESQTTHGLFPEAILWPISKATGTNCLLSWLPPKPTSKQLFLCDVFFCRRTKFLLLLLLFFFI